MSPDTRLRVRRTAIVVLILGTFIAAVVGTLTYSRGLADSDAKPGETCIYQVSGRELCGPRAREFCDRTEATRPADDREGRAACARIREQPVGG